MEDTRKVKVIEREAQRAYLMLKDAQTDSRRIAMTAIWRALMWAIKMDKTAPTKRMERYT